MITQDVLKSYVRYDRETGHFFWIRKFGKVSIGQKAGYRTVNGYIQIRIDNHIYVAHRLAWLYEYGKHPSLFIDHINRIKDDNRISNLRLATKSQNAQNTTITYKNTSGYKGVSYKKEDKKWRAYIKVNQKFKHLGVFDTPEQAYQKYCEAASVMHTHNCCGCR